MGTPMTPGSKSENLEDVIDLAWNNEGKLKIKHNLNCYIFIVDYKCSIHSVDNIY